MGCVRRGPGNPRDDLVTRSAIYIMAEQEEEYERPRKMPRTLKEKDSGKRLIVILERASLETVKVNQLSFLASDNISVVVSAVPIHVVHLIEGWLATFDSWTIDHSRKSLYMWKCSLQLWLMQLKQLQRKPRRKKSEGSTGFEPTEHFHVTSLPPCRRAKTIHFLRIFSGLYL